MDEKVERNETQLDSCAIAEANEASALAPDTEGYVETIDEFFGIKVPIY